MTAFDDARTVEARSLLALRPFLEETQGSFVLTGKGHLARHLQDTIGDLLLNDRQGRVWAVEMKAEQKWTGNLFLETWSNRNLEDQANHAYCGSKPGWLYHTQADLLFYHFLDVDRLVILNVFALKRWAFRDPRQQLSEVNSRGERRGLHGRVYDFEVKKQGKYQQLNDTWGSLVPVSALTKELKPAPKVLSVRQLHLDVFGEAA